MHRVAEHLDEAIDVVAPPIGDIGHAVAISAKGLLIGDGLSRHRIGVEIIIDMQSVDIVTAHDVGGHVADVFTVFGEARIKDVEAVVFEEALRMAHVGVRSSQFLGSLGFGAEGIYPGVELHAAAVAFPHHPGQRVPQRRGRLSLPAGQEAAPGFQGALIERIGLAAHLKDDGVDTTGLQLVELVRQVALHFIAAHALKLAIDNLYPRTAKFSLGKGVRLRPQRQYCHEEE